MVCDLVPHRVPHHLGELRRCAGPPFERPAIDRDLVREYPGVPAAAIRQRHAAVVTEETVVTRGVLDHDLDVGKLRTEPVRKRLNRISDKALEIRRATEASADRFAPGASDGFANDVGRSP